MSCTTPTKPRSRRPRPAGARCVLGSAVFAIVAIDANPPIVVHTESDGGFVFEGLIRRDYRIEAALDDRYAGPARLRLSDKTEPVTLHASISATSLVA